MKIKPNRPLRGDEGMLKAGVEVEVNDTYGRALVKRGLATEVGAKPAASKENTGGKPAKGATAPKGE
jgi:hypothetical protein